MADATPSRSLMSMLSLTLSLAVRSASSEVPTVDWVRRVEHLGWRLNPLRVYVEFVAESAQAASRWRFP